MSEDQDLKPIDALPPLDAFERAWTGHLAEPDVELSRSSEAFVQGVLDKHDAAAQRPMIVGRIGIGPLPYAAAAAVLIAALIGGYLLVGNGSSGQYTTDLTSKDQPAPPSHPNVEGNHDNNAAPSQPDAAPRVAVVDPSKLQLGQMISQTQANVTKPATNLTQTVSEAPQALSLEKLLDLIGNPVPDLKKMLAPLKTSDEPQSRA